MQAATMPGSTESDGAWNETFEALAKFRKEGKCLNSSGDPKLHRWMVEQRREEEMGKLTFERYCGLTFIGFEWERDETSSNKPGGSTETVDNSSRVVEKQEKISSDSVERDRKWTYKFKALEKFKAKHGHLKVPGAAKEENPLIPLYKWANDQKRSNTARKLGSYRYKKLQAIGFFDRSGTSQTHSGTCARRKKRNSNGGGAINCKPCKVMPRKVVQEQRWTMKLEMLKKFKAIHGHLVVPWRDDFLYKWMIDQRKYYRANKLIESRRERLQAIGFDWTRKKSPGSTSLSNAWKEELKAYKRENKHVNVSSADNSELHRWLNQQKRQIASETLERSKRRKLVRLGVDPTLQNSQEEEEKNILWNRRYDELKAHKEKHGHIRASREEYKSLENWLCVQRRAHCKGKLSQLRLDQMNDLEPLWLTPRDISMTQDPCFATHMESSRKTTRDVAKLSSAEKKRSPRTQNEPAAGGPKGQVPAASQERCDRLWTEMYKKLVTYKRKNNHIRVSVRYSERLQSWIRTQRKKFRSGQLARDRLDRMDALDISWRIPRSILGNDNNYVAAARSNLPPTNVTAESPEFKMTSHQVHNSRQETDNIREWNRRYHELRAHKEKYGHIRASRNVYTSLESWLRVQRTAHNKGKLSQKRLDRMNCLEPLWLTPKAISKTQGGCVATNMETLCDSKRKLNNCEKKGSLRQLHTPQTAESPQVRSNCTNPRNAVAWDKKYKELVEYNINHGHLYVTAEENKPLERWLAWQRERHRAGVLEPDRYYKLSKLGKDWPDRSAARDFKEWMNQFKEFNDFVALNGNDVMPFSDTPMHAWIIWQRSRYTTLSLESERVDLLNSTGFRWTAAAPKVSMKRTREEAFDSSAAFVAPTDAIAPSPASSKRHQGGLESVETVNNAARVDEEFVIRPRFTPTQYPRIPSPVNAVSIPTWTTVSTSDLNDVIKGTRNGAIADEDAAYEYMKIKRR